MSTPSSRSVGGSTSTALQFEKVTKRFRGRESRTGSLDAIRNVDLLIERDEAVGIIGPNGAGKSTLLKLAAGVTAPTVGRITRTTKSIAVIELGAGLHPDLTGRESIEFLGRLANGRGVPDASTLDEIIDFTGLGSDLDHHTRTYSTGMIARLAFSVAIHLATDLLLVDEVLSVGDLEFQQRCQERIFALRSQGTTVVLVSHDLALVSALCDRTVLLVDGRVDWDGSTDATIRRYLGKAMKLQDDVVLGLVLSERSYTSGRPVEAAFDVPASAGATNARLQLVVPTPPEIHNEVGPLLVVGDTSFRLDGNDRYVISVPTAGLPPGRYELHIILERSNSEAVASQAAAFSITGPPGPNTIQMSSTLSVDHLLRRPMAEPV